MLTIMNDVLIMRRGDMPSETCPENITIYDEVNVKPVIIETVLYLYQLIITILIVVYREFYPLPSHPIISCGWTPVVK